MKLLSDTLVGKIGKIIRIPFLNMTFMTFQERACILYSHGLNLKGRVVGGTTLHPNKEKDLFPVRVPAGSKWLAGNNGKRQVHTTN